MRYEDPRPDLVEQRRDRVRGYLHIERPRVGRHRAEVLVQRLGVARELHAFEIVRPNTDAENVEPCLFVGRGRRCGGHSAASSTAAPRLVHDVNLEAAAYENSLIAFASVRCRFPCLAELSGAMPEHERKFTGIDRNLIKYI